MAGWEEQAQLDGTAPETTGDELLEAAQDEWERYTGMVTEFVRQRPLAAVAGALLLGYLGGRLAARR